MTTTTDTIRELGSRRAAAEQRADLTELDAITTDDFTLVGPLGFVLDKQQWLDRYRTDGLRTTTLQLHDVDVRDYGATAVTIGIHTQQGEVDGHPIDGSFRITQVYVRDGERWALAGAHLSPIGAMPFRPPTA